MRPGVWRSWFFAAVIACAAFAGGAWSQSWWQRSSAASRVKDDLIHLHTARTAIEAYASANGRWPRQLDEALGAGFASGGDVAALRQRCRMKYIPISENECVRGYVLIVEADPRYCDETFVHVSFYERRGDEWRTVYNVTHVRLGDKDA